MRTLFLTAIALTLFCSAVLAGEPVPWGSNGSRNAVVEAEGLPETIGPENELWAHELGGGRFMNIISVYGDKAVCIASGRTAPTKRLDRRDNMLLVINVHTGEILLEILIPPQPDRSGACYERFSLRKATALAVVGVAARVCLVEDRIASARIAVGAAAPVPLLAREAGALLADQAPGEAVLASAASKASEEVSPISDLRGSAEGRRSLVETLTRRALEEALHRAGCGPTSRALDRHRPKRGTAKGHGSKAQRWIKKSWSQSTSTHVSTSWVSSPTPPYRT